jgi:hypothetical protein
MADGVLKWAKSQRAIWVREIKLLESRKKTTFEIRSGKIVDTTSETLDDRRVRLSDLETQIAKHESPNG